MADVRVTTGRRSREVGERVGVQVNVFGLRSLQGITGEELRDLLMSASEVALREAQEDWPKITWASHDSIALVEVEVGRTLARVALQAGGPTLISDPRNKSGKDYAPYIEFNGTATAPAGILAHSVISNDRIIKASLRDGLAALIRSKLA